MTTNVFEELGFDAEEATNLRARSKLMHAIKSEIRKNEWSQAEAAERLGTTQPRINDLIQGKIDRFSLDYLMNLATDCGLDVGISIKGREPA